MAAESTIAIVLITGLRKWLDRAEGSETDSTTPASTRAGQRDIVNDELWNQTSLIIKSLGKDPERWREIAEFIKTSRYQSRTACRCLDLLQKVSDLVKSDDRA